MLLTSSLLKIELCDTCKLPVIEAKAEQVRGEYIIHYFVASHAYYNFKLQSLDPGP
jgi:hypothetical protein